MAGSVAVDVRTQRMARLFLQLGGPGVNNRVRLEGVAFGYSALTANVRTIRGGIDNISNRNPTGPGFINVGSVEKNPGYSTGTIEVRETITGIPLLSTLETCPFNVYEVVGSDCSALSDPLQGYANGGYVRVLGNCKITDSVDSGARSSFTDDNPMVDKINFSVTGTSFDHGSLSFTALATANASDLATTLTTDATYGNQVLCGNCGQANDGTYLKYWSAASTTASPGGKPGIFYQLGDSTPVYQSVASAGVAENLTFICVIGSYLVVGSSTAGGAGIGGYHYATVGVTGVPGTWTKVVSGFQSNHEPTDVLILSDSDVLFAANGGYIYRLISVPAGVTTISAGAATTANLQRIGGNRNLIVSVGATGTIIYSTNSGRTFAASPTTPAFSSASVTAVDTVGNNGIWLGTATGRVFNSVDRGNSWTEITFDQSGTGSVNDFYIVNDQEMYFLHVTAGNVGRIFRSYDGGRSWANQSPAIDSLASYNSLVRIAAPLVGNETLRCNNVLVAGGNTSTQGLLLSGVAQIF